MLHDSFLDGWDVLGDVGCHEVMELISHALILFGRGSSVVGSGHGAI